MNTEVIMNDDSRYIDLLKSTDLFKELLDYRNFDRTRNKRSIHRTSRILMNLISNTKHDRISRGLPVLFTKEEYKTQFYNLIPIYIHNERFIYVPNPPENVSVYYHVYNCLIEELGLSVLNEIYENLDIRIKNLTPCVKALTYYNRDIEKKSLAEKWLLGFELKEPEKRDLGFQRTIEYDQNSLEMVQLILELANDFIILVFDDIESISDEYGFWFFEQLNNLQRNTKRFILELVCRKDQWNRITKIAGSFIDILAPEIEFYDLTELKLFIKKAMDTFWQKNKVDPPKNRYFPLRETDLDKLFEEFEGNVKKILNSCIETIEETINSQH